MAAVLRLEKNLLGRDFAVGDIHGCFSILEQALTEASFDPARDRIIGVGDLINRGPESKRALEFLKKDYFYTVRGNHEHELWKDALQMNQKGKDAVRDEYERDGLGWILSLNESEQTEFIEAFKTLPYAIEVPLKTGELVGFTHAEIPKELSWQEFIQKLKEEDERVLQTALFGRSRIVQAYKNGFDTDPGVEGVTKIFTGHSLAAQRGANKMGNWFCIDTGAGMRWTEDIFPKCDPADLHLSLVDVRAEASELQRKKLLDDDRPYHIIHASGPG